MKKQIEAIDLLDEILNQATMSFVSCEVSYKYIMNINRESKKSEALLQTKFFNSEKMALLRSLYIVKHHKNKEQVKIVYKKIKEMYEQVEAMQNEFGKNLNLPEEVLYLLVR